MSAIIDNPPADVRERDVEELETVTIRFAGDSGDGMQLTGTQFTNTSAIFGNDISTLPDFPAEIRAPAGSLPGVSGFQLNFSSQRHPHARRPAERAGRDEPGGAQGQPRRPRRRRHAHHQHRRVQQGEPEEGQLRVEPARRRHAQGLPRPPAADHDAQHPRAARGRRAALAQGDGSLQELLRARHPLLALRPPDGADARLDRREVQEEPGGRAAPTRSRSKTGYNFADTTEVFTTHYTVKKAADRAGQVPQDHGQRGDGHRLRRRRRSSPAARSSTARTRSRPPPTSCTSWRATRISASRPFRPRTRSRPSAPPSARASPATSG